MRNWYNKHQEREKWSSVSSDSSLVGLLMLNSHKIYKPKL